MLRAVKHFGIVKFKKNLTSFETFKAFAEMKRLMCKRYLGRGYARKKGSGLELKRKFSFSYFRENFRENLFSF
jgi:hypothetical protein